MTIVFVILKALGYIGWSWWLVFAPSIFVVTMAIIVLVGAAAEQTTAIVADYQAGVAVETIAVAVGKSVRSVVAKLSREGVYKAKVRVTKTGEPVVKNKTALAKVIAVVKAAVLTDANDVS